MIGTVIGTVKNIATGTCTIGRHDVAEKKQRFFLDGESEERYSVFWRPIKEQNTFWGEELHGHVILSTHEGTNGTSSTSITTTTDAILHRLSIKSSWCHKFVIIIIYFFIVIL